MEALIALLFIIILIVVINQNSKLFNQLQKIEHELKKLKNNFNSFSAPTEEKRDAPVINIKPPTTSYESIFSPVKNTAPTEESFAEIKNENIRTRKALF